MLGSNFQDHGSQLLGFLAKHVVKTACALADPIRKRFEHAALTRSSAEHHRMLHGVSCYIYSVMGPKTIILIIKAPIL